MINNKLLKYGAVSIDPQMNTNTYYTTNIFVVGCGGTGGRLIPGLVQHVVNHNRVIETVPVNKQFLKHRMQLTFIDGDIVETKNLLRQNFYTFDVGKNKAEVMALRYGALNGLDINFEPSYLKENGSTILSVHGDANTIVFDCTDNLSARRIIEKQIYGNKQYIISCGNEDTFGQVLLSINTNTYGDFFKKKLGNLIKLKNGIDNPNFKWKESFSYLPTLLETYPTFKDTVAPSCTDIVLQDEQSMPINALVAQLAYNVFYNLVAGNKFTYNMVKCSTNNIYDTKFISHPIALYDLYLKAIIGSSSDEAQACLADAFLIGFKDTNSFSFIEHPKIETLIGRYGRHMRPFIKAYLKSAYNTPIDVQTRFNTFLDTWDREDANI